jgi:chaperonin GroEL (HSP60 family)
MKVTRTAVENEASIAGLVLTTECALRCWHRHSSGDEQGS